MGLLLTFISLRWLLLSVLHLQFICSFDLLLAQLNRRLGKALTLTQFFYNACFFKLLFVLLQRFVNGLAFFNGYDQHNCVPFLIFWTAKIRHFLFRPKVHHYLNKNQAISLNHI